MKITLSRPWTDADGVTHPADADVEVPANTARSLLHHGLARAAAAEAVPDPEPETTPEESTTGAAEEEA